MDQSYDNQKEKVRERNLFRKKFDQITLEHYANHKNKNNKKSRLS